LSRSIKVDASTHTIALGGSWLCGIQAERLTASGSLFLNKGFVSKATLNLKGATISGQLNCEEAEIEGRGVSLDIEGAEISGGVFLSHGFVARGDVRMLRARISGELNCESGTFAKKDGYALAGDGARVKGGIFLTNGFRAEGEVRFLSARVDGQFICDGGSFSNSSMVALGLDGLILDGDLSLRNGFSAEGDVILNGASVKNLFCVRGSFNGALLLERASVDATLFLRNIRVLRGPLDLMHANVGQLSDDETSWPVEKMLQVQGFDYGSIAPGSPTDATTRLRWLRLQPSFSPQTFQTLARVLRAGGHASAAREVLVALEDERNAHDSFSRLQRLGRWFYRSLGYGYEPRRGVAGWAGLVVLVGWLFVWLGRQLMVPTEPHAAAAGFSPLLYSIDSFLPIHAFHEADKWWPRAEDFEWCLCPPSLWIVPWGWLLRAWLCLEIVSGWALLALFASASAGIVRSE
jgi:cytoskeletal protein CcmA (bactofilin family)